MDKCTSVLLLNICHLSFIVSFVVVVVVVVVLNRLGVKLCILWKQKYHFVQWIKKKVGAVLEWWYEQSHLGSVIMINDHWRKF